MTEEEKMGKLPPKPETVTYIILLTALQVALDATLELEKTKYIQGKAKDKLREALNMLTLNNAKNRNRVWGIDEKKAADMTYAIRELGKSIAQSDATCLHLLTKLVRDKYDLRKLKIVEMSDRQVANFEKKLLEEKRAQEEQ